jgi:hypothetical protein
MVAPFNFPGDVSGAVVGAWAMAAQTDASNMTRASLV